MERIIKKLNCMILIMAIIFMPLIFLVRSYIYSSSLTHVCYFLYTIIPIEIIMYLYFVIKKKIRISKYDIFIFLLAVLGIIVTINAVDVDTSIWGAYLRNEGLLSLISYYLLFLNSKVLEKKEIKYIINVLFGVGIIQFIYCILQVFVRGNLVEGFTIAGVKYMASGFVGNPNMLGSFCILLLGISLMFYFLYGGKKYFILSMIFFINLIMAQSTGPFFALIILFVFIIIFLKLKNNFNWKKLLLILSSFIITFIVVSNGIELYVSNVFNDKIVKSYTIKGDILNTFSLFSDSGDASGESEITLDNYGSGRITIWKNTLQIVPKYFWLGAGIDNFGYVYPAHLEGLYYDKAHNEYLQMLITEGVITLLVYLCLLFNLFIDGVKSHNKLCWVLLSGVIGYALQAFLNISVVNVAYMYFIVLGMLAGLINQEKV